MYAALLQVFFLFIPKFKEHKPHSHARMYSYINNTPAWSLTIFPVPDNEAIKQLFELFVTSVRTAK
jgi:hypothetical protein